MLLGDLAYPELEGRGDAVHLLPLGATEPHGPHAPLATDTLISVGICRRAAERLRGEVDVLVLPPLPYGVTRYAADFPGAIGVSEGALAVLIGDLARQLERLVLVNSHFEPEQVETLRATGLPLLDVTRRKNAERLTEEFRIGSCHAGRYETSLVLADRPELVDRDRMEALDAKIVDMPGAIAEGRTDFLAMSMDRAYCGSPAEATSEEGEETFDTLAEMLVELIREVSPVITYDDLPRELNLATHFVDRNVEEGRGGRTALIGPGGPTTYAELAELVNRSGNVLLDLGVRPEERVLLVLADSVELVALWYGAQKIGAVTAEAYTFLQPKDYAYYLDYTRAGVVVADETTEAAIRQAAEGSRWLREILVVDGSFEERLAGASPELESAPTTKDDIAIWKFTTGSTGQPKAAVHPTHSPVLSFEWYARGVLDLRPDDVVLAIPKLFFGYARDLAALFPFGVGAAGIVFPERSTPERIFELIGEHKPTILVNVPTMMAQMVAKTVQPGHDECLTLDMSPVRLCTSAGEALPRELHDRWLDTFGVEVLDGIGSSEAYHIYISNRPGRVKPGSTGELVPGYEAHIADNGELWIEGDTAALLYWGEHEKTKQTFHGDQVRTGDLFERDADGYFWYRGRADDLIKVGGIWVAPAEIEHCLIGHPAVVECAVVGAQHNGLTLARAYVVAGEPLEEQELMDFAREHLAGHKVPREIHFVDDLPRTPSGKLDRKALR